MARDRDIPVVCRGLDELLARGDVDAVVNLTPITPHSLDAETGPDRTQVLARASLVEHLADCLNAGTPPLPSATRARHVLEIMLAAQKAAATGRTILLTTAFEA